MIQQRRSILPVFFWWLISLAAVNANEESDMSCVGVRSTYIDREYCAAVYTDTACHSWEECHSTTSASCSSVCAVAGCECSFESLNCTDGEDCGIFTCLPPDEPAYVGSCAFIDNEKGCESVTGCYWAGPDTTGVVVATHVESASSVTGLGILVMVLVIIGVVLLLLVPLIVYICMRKRTAATIPDEPYPANPKTDDIPVAPAVAIDVEDQSVEDLK